jgi:hypothetical protein
MAIDKLCTVPVRPQFPRDPRVALAREKYFSLRPRPLEQWLWRQHVPPSAERVFWLHWQEGMRHADWCSEIPLRRVAQLCCLDISTVTRSYQLLSSLGLIRRADPGRDPANPFQQATVITEVLVPRELLLELDRHPNRARALAGPSAAAPGTAPAAEAAAPEPSAVPDPAPVRIDPFADLSWRQRLRALAELTSLMSAAERSQFDAAQRRHCGGLRFDEASRLGPEQRAQVLQWLELSALKPAAPAALEPGRGAVAAAPAAGRALTVFELARLRRQLQGLVDPAAVNERLREVAWSIEQGALRRFQCLHAMRIALKKIREGQWSRPHGMPPNWAREWAWSGGQGRAGAVA